MAVGVRFKWWKLFQIRNTKLVSCPMMLKKVQVFQFISVSSDNSNESYFVKQDVTHLSIGIASMINSSVAVSTLIVNQNPYY